MGSSWGDAALAPCMTHGPPHTIQMKQELKYLSCLDLTALANFPKGYRTCVPTQSAPGQHAKPSSFLHVQCSPPRYNAAVHIQCSPAHAKQPQIHNAGTDVQCSAACTTLACKMP